jgi:hypothetical protein
MTNFSKLKKTFCAFAFVGIVGGTGIAASSLLTSCSNGEKAIKVKIDGYLKQNDGRTTTITVTGVNGVNLPINGSKVTQIKASGVTFTDWNTNGNTCSTVAK